MTYPNTYTTKSEEVELSKSGNYICHNWDDFPFKRRGAIGGLLGANPVVCGGHPYTDECYIVTRKKAHLVRKMSTIRNDAAIVPMNSTRLWISGGSNGKYTIASSEFLQLDGTTPGPELPKALQRHVMINLSNKLTIIIGGKDAHTKTFVYDHQKGEWSNGPEINEARHRHAGGIVTDDTTKEKFVIVSGGIYHGEIGLKSTEILLGDYWLRGKKMISKPIVWTLSLISKFIAGPDLPTALSGHSMIPLGLGQVILGGKIYNSYQSKIYHMTCSQRDFTVTKMDQELSVARERFVAIPIPDTISGCMTEGIAGPSKLQLILGWSELYTTF
jgi:hypothetical protein